MFIVFKVHATHRDLHSFPTRRSSDLWSHQEAGGEGRKRRHQRGKRIARGEEGRRDVARVISEDEEIVLLEEIAAGDAEQDRKSTRLNSSHANISYAVFCLKKKTKKQK